VRDDPAVSQAVIRQTPLLKIAPKSKAGMDILQLAVKLKRMRDAGLDDLAARDGLSLPAQNLRD
jgi:flagellar biosynthesis protein FlhG